MEESNSVNNNYESKAVEKKDEDVITIKLSRNYLKLS